MTFRHGFFCGRVLVLVTAALASSHPTWAIDITQDRPVLLAQTAVPSTNAREMPEKGQTTAITGAGIDTRSSVNDFQGLVQQAGSSGVDERVTRQSNDSYFSMVAFHNFWISLGLLLSLISLILAAWAVHLAREGKSRFAGLRKRIEKQLSDADNAADSRALEHRKEIDILGREFKNHLTNRSSAGVSLDFPSAKTVRAASLAHFRESTLSDSSESAYRVATPAPVELVVHEARPPVSISALNAEVLRCIELLARAGTQITEANAAVRIGGSSRSEELKQGLQTLVVRFFTAAGDASAINVELLAWTCSDQEPLQVVPHPQAGRVGQFNKWFDLGSGEYGTQPVLASRPATAQLVNQKLVPIMLGTLS